MEKKNPSSPFYSICLYLLVMTNAIALDQIVYSITTLLKLCFLCEYNAVFISFKPVFSFVFFCFVLFFKRGTDLPRLRWGVV